MNNLYKVLRRFKTLSIFVQQMGQRQMGVEHSNVKADQHPPLPAKSRLAISIVASGIQRNLRHGNVAEARIT